MRYYSYFLFFYVIFLCSCETQKDKDVNADYKDALSVRYTCGVPQTDDRAWYTSGKRAPILKGLNGLHFPVSTKKAEVQTYFNQGLMLSFGFNHAEAARSFYEAARLDSTCAMAWWGYAYVLGPNYNAGMEKDNFQRAYEAVQKANAMSPGATPLERDLIEALSSRYSGDTNVERKVLDSSYAAAMRIVYHKYSSNATIAALFAESLMDLHPWNLWQKDGSMQPWTAEIVAVLKEGIKADARHAGVNHFYIHATEMSQHAEDANYSADLLRDLVPGSGHLLHMPSHTYIRTGRYHDGVLCNQKAVLADSGYVEACNAQGAYPLAYFPHNYHFIAACATLTGESKIAMEGAIGTSDYAHKKLLRDPAWATLQHYYSIPWYVRVKLGLWKEILEDKGPDKDLTYPRIVWNYAGGMALLAQNKIEDAKVKLAEINTLMKDTSLKDLTIWGINNIYDLCVIASTVLDAEIKAKEKNYTQAIVLLTKAVALEDALNYDEPPDWFFSLRHHLGAVLMDAGKYVEAKKVYEEDLKTFRENGWALRGLMQVYDKLHDSRNLEATRVRFNKAWKYADIKIESSRIL